MSGGKVVQIGGNKEAMTFRLDPALAKWLREAAEKSGGRMTMTDYVETALRNTREVRDAGKLLQKISQDQQTTLTETKEHREAVEDFRQDVAERYGALLEWQKKQNNAANSEIKNAGESMAAALRTLQQQMARMEAGLAQVEQQVYRQANELSGNRLSLPQTLGIVGLVVLALGGAVWLGLMGRYYWLTHFG